MPSGSEAEGVLTDIEPDRVSKKPPQSRVRSTAPPLGKGERASQGTPMRNEIRGSAGSKANAKSLRTNATPPEVVLWSRLRRRQLGGFRFRRQHPLGPFVADFYCHEAGLVVEVDSSYHDRARDAQRDAWMRAHSVRVLRVTAGDIETRLDDVLATILRECRKLQ